MRHEALPQTMTVEQLGDWINTNRIDTLNHTEKIQLTPTEIAELEKSSSLASRAIIKLQDIKKQFDRFLKKGTPFNQERQDHEPVNITITPTKGLEALESNREFAERQLALGYREDITAIFFIPWPEYSKVLAFDVEGHEWSTYSRKMTSDEAKQHGRPILEASREFNKQAKLSAGEREELGI